MGGQIDWGALEVISVMFGIEDIEALIYQLEAIRNSQGEED